MKEQLIEVAVFAPLRTRFCYRSAVTDERGSVRTGQMVRVPFGKSSRMGVITAVDPETPQFQGELKAISEFCDPEPVFDAQDLALGQWAANYYHHPLGEVLAAMLPSLVRQRGRRIINQRVTWHLANGDVASKVSPRAKRQHEVLQFIGPNGAAEDALATLEFDWRRPLRELSSKGLLTKQVENLRTEDASEPVTQFSPAPLNDEQQNIVAALLSGDASFTPSLLHGVTGSGKTNVYIGLIAGLLERGGQALLLLPEIAITQQLVDRFEASFGDCVAVSHSGLGDKRRAQVWTQFKQGKIKILLGTRSAVWVSARDLRCIIVDEEHDPSYKQLEGFRYHARDVAVYRASRLKIPVVLGSATPSFESYRNAKNGKYRLHILPNRATGARIPALHIEDVRSLKLQAGLSQRLIAAIRDRLSRGQQTILFLNRRGYAPVMLCHHCGQVWECDRCDSKLVLHREKKVLICHQCDKRVPTTTLPSCCETPEMVAVGQGTEQLAEQLQALFPEHKIKRIDRDTVRKKTELDEILRQAKHGEIDILLGTQMLAKGHDFPNVTLVGVVDADARLFSLDFRAEERLAQLIIQVAGRAGRAELKGEVIVQTRQPFHWIFDALAAGSYDNFLQRGLAEREQAHLPPFVQSALIRAEAVKRDAPYAFLNKIVRELKLDPNLDSVFGPIPSQLERRAGKYRAEIIFFAETRQRLTALLAKAVKCAESAPEKSRVRWQVDVDPQDA